MIEVKDLRVRFGALQAVDGLSLRVPEGCLFGLLGPNGAGKTTTISCIAGLLRPDEGSIRVGGVDAVASPGAAQALLGVVPQKLALYGELSVTRNLRIFAGLRGLAGKVLSQRVEWGLALAQLEGKTSARVDTLSGGMKRRLNLACSLLHDPRIIICDEPTTGVDPQSRHHLFETIRALHAEGRTVVYTTHYMEEVEALCERVAVVDAGRLVVEGGLSELLAKDAPTSHQLRLREGTEADAIARALEAAGLQVDTVTAAQRSLEDLFLELTGHSLRDGGA